jgi:hypothetical protein
MARRERRISEEEESRTWKYLLFDIALTLLLGPLVEKWKRRSRR